MVTRTLTADDFDAVFTAFSDAFSDYVVKLSPTREQLTEMLTRRGWVPQASVAVIDGQRIVAFTLNGVEGDHAYDSGTGVVPSHRRRGLGAAVMNESVRVLRERGCKTYVLEVLDNNPAAIELYRGLGFVETRGLQCWTFTAPAKDGGLKAAAPQASWQNSDGSLARARDRHVRIDGDGGYVVVFPATGDLQFRGVVTSALLDRAAEIAGKPLRIMNIDERDAAFAAFLEAAGAQKTVRQIEMSRAL